jgi:tetratricopeptide (TPR) repeat protein
MEHKLWLRAQRYVAEGQLTAAYIALQSLLQRAPGHAQARVLMAGVILAEGRLQEASTQVLAAARNMPPDAAGICMLAQCLLRVGEVNAARACFDHPEIARTRDAQALAQLAHVRQMLGEHRESLALMDRARALGFDNPDFRYFRAIQLQFNGRIAEAETELEACLRKGPTFGRASLTLARLNRQTESSNHLAYIRAQLPRVPTNSEDHAAFEFAQYKELEDLGHYDDAWQALSRGNAIMYQRMQHDPQREVRLFDALIAATSSPPPPLPYSAEGPQPIFIVGLPRSGTTLLERILSNHSQVTSAGELGDFPRQMRWVADHHGRALLDETLISRLPRLDYARIGHRYLQQTQWRAEGRAWYVDKLPPNWMLVGLIRRALPNAPILHMVRDGMDACYSNYKALFGEAYPYSYNLDALGSHYLQYIRLMDHWHKSLPDQLMDVRYNDLVDDPEAMARRVLEYCGLPYEADTADVTRNAAPVATLSSAQVREPIHRRALGEWRRYAQQLEPLRRRIESL